MSVVLALLTASAGDGTFMRLWLWILFLSVAACATTAATIAAINPTSRLRTPVDPAFLYRNSRGTATPAAGALLHESWEGFRADMTLREAAAPTGVRIGAAYNYNHGGSDMSYKAVSEREFDLFTGENACKWSATEPQKNVYNWIECDAILAAASDTQGGVMRGHNLCWGRYNPAWVNSVPTDQLASTLVAHINTTVTRYNNARNVICWDVVNEAVADGNSKTPVLKPAQPWYPALPDYVDVAFRAADAARSGSTSRIATEQQQQQQQPRLELFYNEYGAEDMGTKADKVYNLLKSMRSRGVAVDGVGLQMHISVQRHPSFSDVAANMARLAALNLTIHITEMDVKCPAESCDLRAQAAVYAGMLKACLDQPACKSFETWGVTDKYTWIGSDQRPLLIAQNYTKKPAYNEILAVFQNHTRSSSSSHHRR